MNLNLNGKYHKIYEKYCHEIISYFCEGVPPKEITKKLHDEFGVNISYQGINFFYNNNKEYIDNCIKKRKNEKLNQIKDTIAAELVVDRLKEFFYLLSADLPSIVAALEDEDKAKVIVSVSNTIAKFAGMEKTEINVNQMDLSSIFGDDLNWE